MVLEARSVGHPDPDGFAMTPQFSTIVKARHHQSGGIFSVHAVDLSEMDGLASPLALLDDFRVSGAPFGPHPHAGFSAISYVLEDSAVALRSRDSLGNDLEIRPGGLVWLEAGWGALHQEVPAAPGELHGAQIYVNLSARNKLVAPRTMAVQPEDVPVWTSPAGDRVRVLVGRYRSLASPIVPTEPFAILEALVATSLSLPIVQGEHTVIYNLSGTLDVAAGQVSRRLLAHSALAVADAGELTLTTIGGPTHALVLSGPALADPVFAEGPFIMNDEDGFRAAIRRYHAGEMGQLDPV